MYFHTCMVTNVNKHATLIFTDSKYIQNCLTIFKNAVKNQTKHKQDKNL